MTDADDDADTVAISNTTTAAGQGNGPSTAGAPSRTVGANTTQRVVRIPVSALRQGNGRVTIRLNQANNNSNNNNIATSALQQAQRINQGRIVFGQANNIANPPPSGNENGIFSRDVANNGDTTTNNNNDNTATMGIRWNSQPPQPNNNGIDVSFPGRGGRGRGHVHINQRLRPPRLEPQQLPESQQEWNDLQVASPPTTTTTTATTTSAPTPTTATANESKEEKQSENDMEEKNENEESNKNSTENENSGTEQNESDNNNNESTNTTNTNDVHNSDVHDPFKCAICYEIMNEPSGCGKCASRFCYACLRRVFELSAMPQQQQRRREPSEPTTPPRCPVCRSHVVDGINGIVKDEDLKRRMDQAPPILCRYKGCQELLPLGRIALHESTCLHVKMQCRFHAYGCPWQGKRKELARHERDDCHLAKVSELVERYRSLQSETMHRLAHVQQNVSLNNTMLNWHRNRETQLLSTANYLQIFQFVYCLLCCTPRFLLTKDAWTPFHVDANGRAAVFNAVAMTPTCLLMLKTLASSYLMVLDAFSTDLDTHDKWLDVIDGLLYFLIVAGFAVIIGLCFFAEGGTFQQWQKLPLPLPQRWLDKYRSFRNSNLLLYSALFAMVVFHAFAQDLVFNTSVLRSVLIWAFVALPSVFFPALVTSMSEAVNRPPTVLTDDAVIRIMTTGRAFKPLYLAVAYSLILTVFGVFPTLDAVMMFWMYGKSKMKDQWGLPEPFVEMEYLWLSIVPIPTIAPLTFAYMGLRVAMIRNFSSFESTFLECAWLVVAFVSVIVTKRILFTVTHYGAQAGNMLIQKSRGRIISPGASLLQTEYHGLGLTLFALGGLAMTAVLIT